MPTTLPSLPVELWLQILSYHSIQDLWLNVRQTSPQLQQYADEVIRTTVIPYTYLVTSLSLGAGSRHRWYDTTGTVYCEPQALDRETPRERAIWAVGKVTPDLWRDRTLVRWRHAVGSDSERMVELWTVGESKALGRFSMAILKTEDKSIGPDNVSCDWRVMLSKVLTCDSSGSVVKRALYAGMHGTWAFSGVPIITHLAAKDQAICPNATPLNIALHPYSRNGLKIFWRGQEERTDKRLYMCFAEGDQKLPQGQTRPQRSQ